MTTTATAIKFFEKKEPLYQIDKVVRTKAHRFIIIAINKATAVVQKFLMDESAKTIERI